jgi:hypothetical protein
VGNQQIVLLLLGAVLIGVAVIMGLLIASDSAAGVNRDALINDLQHLGMLAQSHYRTPVVLGGGENSFRGFTVNLRNANGTYRIAELDDHSVTFHASGNEPGADGRPLYVKMSVTANTMEILPSN